MSPERSAMSSWCQRLATTAFVCAVTLGFAGHATAQAPKKDDSTFQTSAPHAILIDADSGTVLFERNADQLMAPSSLAKLMTAEYVFSLIKKGELKFDDEFLISENAWRKGGAPSHGSTMYAAINSRV